MTAPRGHHIRQINRHDEHTYTLPVSTDTGDLPGTLAGYGVYIRQDGLNRHLMSYATMADALAGLARFEAGTPGL